MNLKQELIQRKEEPLIQFLIKQIRIRDDCLKEQQSLIETMAHTIERIQC